MPEDEDPAKPEETHPTQEEGSNPPSREVSPRDHGLPITGRTQQQEPPPEDKSEGILPDVPSWVPTPDISKHVSPHLEHLNPWEDEDSGDEGDFTAETRKYDPSNFSAGASGRERADSVVSQEEAYTIDNAITQIGWGRFQIKLLIIVALSKGFIGMQMLNHSYNQHELKHKWNLSRTEGTLMGSALFLGMMIGSIFWGRVSDVYGRRRVFLLTIFNTFLFGAVSAAAPNYGLYIVCRILLGFGIGGQGPVSISLLLEFTPSYCRGTASGLVWVGWYMGEALETLIGYALDWGQDDYWTQVSVWTSIPPLVLLVAWGLRLIYIPESPRFLLVSGRQRKGWEVLEEAAMANKSVMYRHKLVGITTSKDFVSCCQEDRKASWKGLFTPALLRTTLLLWWIWFVAGYGTYGLMFILPKFFRRNTDQTLEDEHLSMLGTSCGAMVGVLFGAWTSENWGRRTTFAIGFLGAGITILVLNAKMELAIILAFATLCRFFNGVYEAVWYTYTPEVYPTTIRSLGVGVCSSWAKIAGMFAPFVSNILMSCPNKGETGCGATLRTTVVSSIAFLLATLAAVALPIETMGCALQDYAADEARPRRKSGEEKSLLDELDNGDEDEDLNNHVQDTPN